MAEPCACDRVGLLPLQEDACDGTRQDSRCDAARAELQPDGDSADKSAHVGIGYTLATGRLFCDISDFHAYAEELLGRPVWTHEFGNETVWAALREAFEAQQELALTAPGTAAS